MITIYYILLGWTEWVKLQFAMRNITFHGIQRSESEKFSVLISQLYSYPNPGWHMYIVGLLVRTEHFFQENCYVVKSLCTLVLCFICC